jgi:hypothetical protein
MYVWTRSEQDRPNGADPGTAHNIFILNGLARAYGLRCSEKEGLGIRRANCLD